MALTLVVFAHAGKIMIFKEEQVQTLRSTMQWDVDVPSLWVRYEKWNNEAMRIPKKGRESWELSLLYFT